MASAVAFGSAPTSLSDDDDDVSSRVGGVESEDEATPKDTVEENGLEEDDDDLFGDGDEDEDAQPARMRQLDDEELDSGDDEGRTDRVEQAAAVEHEEEQQTFNFMDADIARHSVPEPTDGELYLLKVPRFLSIEPTAFHPKTFQAPTTDHHSKRAPSEHFSAYNTAMTTIRWRRSPSNYAQLQSNARVLRWTDGSLTLQFANDPLTQYEINANMLAPPQVNPKIPTPTSLKAKSKTAEFKESYTYLVAPYEEANVMRVTNKFTTALSVVPAANSRDAALEKLQNDLAAAANRGRDNADQAISFINVDEDPELRRQREEATFKEKQRLARAKEKHELRERERATRTIGRSAVRSTGLSTGFLDDEEGGRSRGPKKPRAKSGSKRDWSDEEDYGFRGRTREDEYDEEDDFIAASDEEPEIVDDEDEDEDDGIMDEPRRRRETQSPKRSRGGDDDDNDDDVIVNRSKKRRVIEDDDEDE